MWIENGGRTNGHEESEKRHHGNERVPFLNKSHFGVKLSWAKDEALRSPPPNGNIQKTSEEIRCFRCQRVSGHLEAPPHQGG